MGLDAERLAQVQRALHWALAWPLPATEAVLPGPRLYLEVLPADNLHERLSGRLHVHTSQVRGIRSWFGGGAPDAPELQQDEYGMPLVGQLVRSVCVSSFSSGEHFLEALLASCNFGWVNIVVSFLPPLSIPLSQMLS